MCMTSIVNCQSIMAPCAHSTFKTLQKQLKISHSFAIWQHCLTCIVLRKEPLLFLTVWTVRLKVSQWHRWVLTFCAQRSYPPPPSTSQSALPQSGSVDIWGRTAQEPVCGDKVLAIIFIGFLLWPSIQFPSEQVGPGSSSTSRGSQPSTQTEGSDGASTHGQHPWQISCQTDSFHWLNTG